MLLMPLFNPIPKDQQGKSVERSHNVNLEQLVAGDQTTVGGGGCECLHPQVFSFPCAVRACVCPCVRARTCVPACVFGCPVPPSSYGAPTLRSVAHGLCSRAVRRPNPKPPRERRHIGAVAGAVRSRRNHRCKTLLATH